MNPSHSTADRATFSRRDSMRLVGLAGLGALLGGGSPLQAQEPAKQSARENFQGAGHYRMALGQATLYLISDGGFDMNPAELFATVPEDQMEEAKRSAFLTSRPVPGHVNTLLVKEEANLILVDTGCGTNFGGSAGKLPGNLKRAGFDPNEITHVILTHAHPDHLGGLVNKDGQLLFPKAQVVVSRAEHDFWTDSPSLPKARLPAEAVAGMAGIAQRTFTAAKPRLELANPGDRVGNVITLVDAPGHTPGHLALDIESGGESLLYVTDAVHLPALQLANPDWQVLYDADPELAAATRQDLLGRAARDRRLIAGSHLPFPSFGHLVQHEGGYRFVPVVWEW